METGVSDPDLFNPDPAFFLSPDPVVSDKRFVHIPGRWPFKGSVSRVLRWVLLYIN